MAMLDFVPVKFFLVHSQRQEDFVLCVSMSFNVYVPIS